MSELCCVCVNDYVYRLNDFIAVGLLQKNPAVISLLSLLKVCCNQNINRTPPALCNQKIIIQ